MKNICVILYLRATLINLATPINGAHAPRVEKGVIANTCGGNRGPTNPKIASFPLILKILKHFSYHYLLPDDLKL